MDMNGPFKPLEELAFAKAGFGRYFIVHSYFTGKTLLPGSSQQCKNLSYDSLKSYLQGACFGKDNKEIHLYNGISPTLKNDFVPEGLFCFKENELEELLFETGLKETFENCVKTIK